ncbi:MAG: multifunctional oxoglutarate decarboxylase/oxoglutarate dehydrogenase thiamine pyrophosphate-binding subunit/dihydrolipoyllysine-residue succinyltransferase subunit [Bacteriodetes bacterium]|nr:multifunctional oxoglutarate decarboxylase/oxoglutarate dehydrogenase thiamine pyrophosphate-binding subunit/dihydrolipoyllysine-residue succinyltransferase subunit [Bacteroidota bacterium]
MNPNDVFIEELYFDFLRDPSSVSQEWQNYFRTQYTREPAGQSVSTASVATKEVPQIREIQNVTISTTDNQGKKAANTSAPKLGELDELILLSGVPEKVAVNMMNSLQVPTATSVRSIPVKALEENRKLIVKFLTKNRRSKISFTHIVAWAIVKSIMKYPHMNDSCYVDANAKVFRVKRGDINIGLAVDVTRKDGSRSLVVPSIKSAQKLTFAEFILQYDELIKKARNNKLTIDDLTGSTCSLTNPGGIGTVMSMPRLMEGQGLIVATGAIEYPAEFHAVVPEALATLAISKVMGVTSTYDHRVIQGAESGEFLQYMHKLLIGEDHFYDQIFASLNIPYEPVRWSIDKRISPFVTQEQNEALEKETLVNQLINAYRVRGHLMANVNPLGLQAFYYPELQPSYYGFTIWDLDREFDTGGLGGVKRATVRDIIDMLRDTYCSEIGIEYMHIQAPEKKFWIQQKVEATKNQNTFSTEEKIHAYTKLMQAESFENYINTKFIGAKRFSLEGSEAILPMVELILNNSSTEKLKGVVIGMAHRGRLNILANLMGKKLEKIFNEFEGIFAPDTFQGSGDVKYHLGAQANYKSEQGEEISIALAPNPSHLEAVNPVVAGMARGLCDEINDRTYTQVLPILIHGDAAFMGQGVVPETLNLANLRGYKTGGSIHIIINNQVGFTTNPEDSRSTTYCSDIAKFLQVPIIHVNGDSPEAVLTAAQLAFEYRTTFNEDVVIDMYSYRKYGHNEGDDPTATQPLLYRRIKRHLSVRALYRQRLIDEKVLSAEQADAIGAEYAAKLNEAFDSRKNTEPLYASVKTAERYDVFSTISTAVSEVTLRTIADGITTIPPVFHIHSKVGDEINRRKQLMNGNAEQISWGLAEAFAFGSLLTEGKAVRITGQDTGRGTFNHRQAVLHDIENEAEYIPLNHISDKQQSLHIFNSPLSEYAVLGYEYGYSVVRTSALTLWEAQFGDFSNGAQIVMDQFISSAELKWGQVSNLTMLLPHGYDGQGPEHSSARLERYLQLCAENNMFVCSFTTPAQLFHALRRQVHAHWRKPLIVMTPKGYLRKVSSPLSQFTSGHFAEVLNDTAVQALDVTRVILCSGMFYYELDAQRKKVSADNVAIVRVEQLYPFPEQHLAEVLAQYPNATELYWAQEEPKNMGAWSFMIQRIPELLKGSQTLKYVGRAESASPATGSGKIHATEQAAILEQAFA